MVSGRQTPDWMKELYYALRHNSLWGFAGGITLAALLQVAFDWTGAWVIVVIGLVVLALLAARSYRNVQEKSTLPLVRQADPQRGLVVMCSVGDIETSAALGAIKFHYKGEEDEREKPTLQHLWIIHSRRYPEEPKPPHLLSSYAMAQELSKRYEPLLGLGNVILHEVKDPDDPYEVFEQATAIYQRASVKFHLKTHELLADITGGTKSMTTGLALAGIPTGRYLQFMKPRSYTPDGRMNVEQGSDPMIIDIDWVERRNYLPDSR